MDRVIAEVEKNTNEIIRAELKKAIEAIEAELRMVAK
jgi:hypothetical protein